MTPKEPLVGGFANNAPEGGARSSVCWPRCSMSLLVGSISRRRSYALALVEERTAELREALAEQRATPGGPTDRPRGRRGGEQSQERVPLAHEPRAADPAERGARLRAAPRDRGPGRGRTTTRSSRSSGAVGTSSTSSTRCSTSPASRPGPSSSPPSRCCADVVMDELLQLTAPLAEQRDIHLIRGSSTGPPRAGRLPAAQADPSQPDQQRNQVQPSGRHRRGVLRACAGSRLRMKVVDTGPGIRSEQRELLFTLFERLGAEQTNIEGTGVGLALSRRLAEAMGGTRRLRVDRRTGQHVLGGAPDRRGPGRAVRAIQRTAAAGRSRRSGCIDHEPRCCTSRTTC